MRYRTKLVVLIAFQIQVLGCRDRGSGLSTRTLGYESSDLKIIGKASLAIAEASGIEWMDVSKREIIVVGDRSFDGVKLPFKNSRPGTAEIVEFSKAAAEWSLNTSEQSKFEAITLDRDNFFILSENSSTIFVVSRSLPMRLVHTIELVIPKSSEINLEWYSAPDLRGEGFILLTDGRIMLLKEKDPVALLEFTRPGASARGYKSGFALTANDKYLLPNGKNSRLTLIKTWPLDPDSGFESGDGSELHVLPSGRLAMLGDQDRALFRIEAEIEPTKKNFELKRAYYFPNQIEKPEGFVTTNDGNLIVVSDTKESKSDLWIMSGVIDD